MSYALALPRAGMGDAVQQAVAGSGTVGVDLATGNIVGAVSSGVAAVSGLITGLIEGCGESCIEATGFANEAEPLLQQNIAAYFDLPAPRSTVDQAAAVQNFLNVWNGLVQSCSNPSLGEAGQKCITDRQAGACTWHQTTTPPWGTPAAGQCWNWWNGYHDPIANDTNVYTPSATSSVSSAVSSLTSSGWALPAIIAAAVLLGLAVSR